MGVEKWNFQQGLTVGKVLLRLLLKFHYPKCVCSDEELRGRPSGSFPDVNKLIKIECFYHETGGWKD